MSQPRIIFAGTPDFAATHLEALIESGANICAVYTQPDRPAGRGRKLQKSPVKQVAEEAGIEVYQPQTLRNQEAQAELATLAADLMIVVAYGLILPQVVLDTPRLGCINVHASILPRWRGAAPIHRALLAGDKETGVTLMQMEAGLDTGPMLAKAVTTITADETSGALHDRLAVLGSELLINELPNLFDGALIPEIQDESQVTYAHKLEKAEGEIDWRESAESTLLQIRGLNPWPVAYTGLDGETLRIWKAELTGSTSGTAEPGTILKADKQGIEVACGQGSIRLLTVQLPGKKATDASALLNSNNHPFVTGKQLG